MTHDSILTLVGLVKAGAATDRIFLRPLTRQVDFALVWEGEPSGQAANEGSLRFYFVRDETGACIGAVEDLGHDIHAVVQPSHRRRGLMSRALQEVVLPHVFSTGIKAQRTRLCSPEGRALALKLGFTLISEDEAEITGDRVQRWVPPGMPVPALGPDRLTAIETRLGLAVDCVRAARKHLEARASAATLDQLDYAAHWIATLADPSVAWPEDQPDTPPPTLPPLDSTAQKEVERMLYCGAGYLRIAADELDGCTEEDRVARIRQLGCRLLDTTRAVRDDWRDQQFRHSGRQRGGGAAAG